MKINKNNPGTYAFILTIICITFITAINLIFFRDNENIRTLLDGMSYGVAVFSQFICHAVVSRVKKDVQNDSDTGFNKKHD